MICIPIVLSEIGRRRSKIYESKNKNNENQIKPQKKKLSKEEQIKIDEENLRNEKINKYFDKAIDYFYKFLVVVALIYVLYHYGIDILFVVIEVTKIIFKDFVGPVIGAVFGLVIDALKFIFAILSYIVLEILIEIPALYYFLSIIIVLLIIVIINQKKR